MIIGFAFSAANQVRVVINGTGWMVEGDVGGDGKADFSIAVLDAAHAIDWSAADFVFL